MPKEKTGQGDKVALFWLLSFPDTHPVVAEMTSDSFQTAREGLHTYALLLDVNSHQGFVHHQQLDTTMDATWKLQEKVKYAP